MLSSPISSCIFQICRLQRITHQNSAIGYCIIDLNCVASGRKLMVGDLYMKLVHEWYVLHTRYHGYEFMF